MQVMDFPIGDYFQVTIEISSDAARHDAAGAVLKRRRHDGESRRRVFWSGETCCAMCNRVDCVTNRHLAVLTCDLCMCASPRVACIKCRGGCQPLTPPSRAAQPYEKARSLSRDSRIRATRRFIKGWRKRPHSGFISPLLSSPNLALCRIQSKPATDLFCCKAGLAGKAVRAGPLTLPPGP